MWGYEKTCITIKTLQLLCGDWEGECSLTRDYYSSSIIKAILNKAILSDDMESYFVDPNCCTGVFWDFLHYKNCILVSVLEITDLPTFTFSMLQFWMLHSYVLYLSNEHLKKSVWLLFFVIVSQSPKYQCSLLAYLFVLGFR